MVVQRQASGIHTTNTKNNYSYVGLVRKGQSGQVGLDVLWVVYGCKPVKNYAEFF